MIKRIQEVDGDIILEITENSSVKRRISEKALLRRQERLRAAIERFEGELGEIDRQLAEVYEERDKAQG